MQHEHLKPAAFLIAAMALSGAPVKAADALIDDFEGGTNQNKFASYWYFYDDHTDGGTSKVTSAKVSGTELLYSDVSIGVDETGGKAAKLAYTMGPTKLSCGTACEFGQYVGFGMDMTPNKKALDLTGATKITYKAKADAPTTLIVEVATTPVTSQAPPQSFATHQVTHNITTSWKTYEISLSETALTNPLKQPSWAKPPVPFDPKYVEKIAWRVTMDAATNPTTGTVLIDSVVVKNYTWVNPAACIACVGKVGEGMGALLSNFDLAPKNQNKLGFYWYAYNDAAGRSVTSQADYSEIFGGVAPNPDLPTLPTLVIDGAKGVGATDAAFIQFKLGPTYTQNGVVIKPFVGVGTRLADDLNVARFNAQASTGISFDYMTTGADIDYIRMEVKDERDLGAGIVHHVLLPSTNGAWSSASIPWTKLVLPDYAEVALIADKTLHTGSLEQVQWTFQGDAKKTGSIAIDNVKIMGMTTINPAGVLSHGIRGGQGLTARRVGGGLQVAVALPSGRHTGSLELLDVRGIVVASRKVDLVGGSRTLVDLNLTNPERGLFLLHLRTGSGKSLQQKWAQLSILD